MIVSGELRELPDGFSGMDNESAMRTILDTHIQNMSVLDELSIKHTSLVRWIRNKK